MYENEKPREKGEDSGDHIPPKKDPEALLRGVEQRRRPEKEPRWYRF